jgi:hypothetical protein
VALVAGTFMSYFLFPWSSNGISFFHPYLDIFCHEEDVYNIMTIMGRVENRLRYILSVSRDQIVKPPSEWMLRGCDLNKDV